MLLTGREFMERKKAMKGGKVTIVNQTIDGKEVDEDTYFDQLGDAIERFPLTLGVKHRS